MDHLAIHGFSCRKSHSRFSRYSAINDTIKIILATAKIPSHLEPVDLMGNAQMVVLSSYGAMGALWCGM